jgi:hypothetical protein
MPAVRRLQVLVVGSALLGAPSGAETTPPVPLRTPSPLVPVETAGSGLAPEARVRIALDARGRVERVEVLRIEPASEFDDLFRATLEATLAEWRYAPQRRDGVAEPTTLEWRVRFPSREEPSAGAAPPLEASSIGEIGPPGFDAATRRARILALPEKQRLALLASQLGVALRFLGERSEASTDWVHVWTDTNAETARAVASNVDALFRTIAARLLPGLESASARHKLQVVVYRSESSYQQLMEATEQFEWSAGFYSPAGLVAFHLEQYSDEAATHILLHEATHAFVDRHLARRGVALPRWLDEGFADYVGNSRIRKGLLEPGRTLKGTIEMGGSGAMRIKTVGALQLDAARAALRKGRGLGVRELIAATPDTFYGENREIFYASAWLLVHYLRDGGEAWATDRFPKLMLYLAEGYSPEAAVRGLYGDPAALDADFRRYVRAF